MWTSTKTPFYINKIKKYHLI